MKVTITIEDSDEYPDKSVTASLERGLILKFSDATPPMLDTVLERIAIAIERDRPEIFPTPATSEFWK